MPHVNGETSEALTFASANCQRPEIPPNDPNLFDLKPALGITHAAEQRGWWEVRASLCVDVTPACERGKEVLHGWSLHLTPRAITSVSSITEQSSSDRSFHNWVCFEA